MVFFDLLIFGYLYVSTPSTIIQKKKIITKIESLNEKKNYTWMKNVSTFILFFFNKLYRIL